MHEQSALDRRRVGGEVVEDQMGLGFGGDLAWRVCRNCFELDRPVTGVQRADHLDAGEVQRGEQALGAVALWVPLRL